MENITKLSLPPCEESPGRQVALGEESLDRRFAEDQLLPISALQHLLYCERQCALIHLEQAWTENRFTAEGRVLHEHAHDNGTASRRDLRVATGVRLRCARLGLYGQADIVEFQRADSAGKVAGASSLPLVPCDDGTAATALLTAECPLAVPLPGVLGLWHPFPVEYKRGKPKSNRADEVQLCAQALCLEEMLGVSIPAGALFYGATRRRLEVAFSAELRALTEATATRLHALLGARITPPALYAKAKCEPCSLLEECQPKLRQHLSAQAYITANLNTP